MSYQNLIRAFKNEPLAEAAFREYRLKKGVICKKCAHTDHYWLASKKQFQCKNCRFRTTLQSGTVLQGSKLPYSYFFIGIHMILNQNFQVNVDDFQSNTGHKYYEPLWDLIYKLKKFVRENQTENFDKHFNEVVADYFLQEVLQD